MVWGTWKTSLLVLSTLTAFTVHLLLFAFAPVIPFIIADFGLSYTEGGAISAICLLAIILTRIPWGFIIDRIGYIRSMRYAMLIMGSGAILRGFASDYISLILFQILMGVGMSAVLPCLAMIVNLEFPNRKGLATGVYVAGFPVGDLVGYTVIAILLPVVQKDWRFILLLFASCGVIMMVLWFMVRHQPNVSTSNASNSISSATMRRLLAQPQVWIVTGMCFCTIGVSDTLLSWLPSLLAIQGISVLEATLIAEMFPLGSLIGGPLVGHLSDHIGQRRPFIGVLAGISAVVIFLIPFLPFIGLMLAILVAGIVISGIITLALAIPTEHPYFTASIGSAVALIASIGNSGSFIFPILVGILLDLTGTIVLPLFALAIIASITLLFSLGLLETGRPRNMDK